MNKKVPLRAVFPILQNILHLAGVKCVGGWLGRDRHSVFLRTQQKEKLLRVHTTDLDGLNVYEPNDFLRVFFCTRPGIQKLNIGLVLLCLIWPLFMRKCSR